MRVRAFVGAVACFAGLVAGCSSSEPTGTSSTAGATGTGTGGGTTGGGTTGGTSTGVSCTPETTFCNGLLVQTCASSGKAATTDEDCASPTTPTPKYDGGYLCVVQSDGGGTCEPSGCVNPTAEAGTFVELTCQCISGRKSYGGHIPADGGGEIYFDAGYCCGPPPDGGFLHPGSPCTDPCECPSGVCLPPFGGGGCE